MPGSRSALARAPKHGSLQKYDPKKGVQSIAVLEAAEKHWARARDVAKLSQAIEAKLEAQAEFVQWWKSLEKNKGGGDTRRAPVTDRLSVPSAEELAKSLGTTLMRISRWKQRLDDPDNFKKTLTSALARYQKILEFAPVDPQLKASDSNEWYTPAPYLASARAVLGAIDLDPASSDVANRTVQAAQIFTQEDDGLAQLWHGRVWLNPPYGGMSGPFVARLIERFTAGDVVAAVVLVNSNSTDAGWFQPLWNYLLCFTDHRINFISPAGAQSGSTHGSVFIYLGPDRDLFAREFSQWGTVVQRYVAL